MDEEIITKNTVITGNHASQTDTSDQKNVSAKQRELCELNASDNHDLDINSVSCQIRLTELLKVIAKNKRQSKNPKTTHQHENPGTSEDFGRTLKPLRKAKYSWQVKNLPEHSMGTTGPSIDNDSSAEEEDEVLGRANVIDSAEPPSKKAKLDEGRSSSVTGTSMTQPRPNLDQNTNFVSSSDRPHSSGSSEKEPGDIAGCTLADALLNEASGEDSASHTSSVEAVSGPSSQSWRTSWRLRMLQNKHIAQSIVDNTLNATLEMLGFCQASNAQTPRQAMSAAQRRTVEEDAVSVVIQARGLQGTDPTPAQNPGLEPADMGHTLGAVPNTPPSLYPAAGTSTRGPGDGALNTPPEGRLTRLVPLLNRLAHFTETLDVDDCPAPQPPHIVHQANLRVADRTDSIGENGLDLDPFLSPTLQTDVLNKAVSAAISQKGLAVDGTL